MAEKPLEKELDDVVGGLSESGKNDSKAEKNDLKDAGDFLIAGSAKPPDYYV